MFNDKYFCFHCLKSGKSHNWSCGTQGHFIARISHKIHLPKITAKRKVWHECVFNDTFLGANLTSRYPDQIKILIKTIEGLR